MTANDAVFRADASPAVGTGHVIRCATLAEALIARGWTATLATRDLPDGMAARLIASGLRILPLDGAATQAAEIEAIRKAADDAPGLLVVDGYGFDAAWLSSMRDRASIVMAIDDLADRHQPVDLLLNQNLGVSEKQVASMVPRGARVLVGPRFALVRREFVERRAHRRVRDGRIERILVFISGADRPNVTERAVEALAGIEVSIDVVIGAAYPYHDDLRSLVDRLPTARLHVNVENMADLMDRADLAIGAPSSASWERCALGLPTVLVVLADNQAIVERGLVDSGAAITASWHTAATPASIRHIVRSLLGDPRRVAEMSRAAAIVTDGRGTDRVVAAIEELVSARTEEQ